MIPTELLFLAEYLVKIALVLALGFLTVRLLKQQGPNIRHRIWITVFLASIAMLAILILPRLPLIPALSTGADTPITATVSPQFHAPVALTPATSLDKGLNAKRFDWGIAVASIWLIGVAIVLGRTAFASYCLRKLKRSHLPVSPQIQKAANTLIESLKVPRPVTLSMSERIKTPFAWGFRRPEIVLPTEAQDWTASELDMVLRHELAHVLRHDPTALLVSRLFVGLNWINPLSWFAARQAMQLREEACDHYVLEGGHPGGDYASLLFSQAQQGSSSHLRTASVSMADHGTVEGRIRKILHPTPLAHQTSQTISVVTISVLTSLSLLVGFAGLSQAQKATPVGDDEQAALIKKLDTLVLPKLELNDTPLNDALAFVHEIVMDIDTTSPAGSRGVNFVLEDSYDPQPKITLKLTNVPLKESLRYITDLAQMEFVVGSHAVIFRKKSAPAATPSAAVPTTPYSGEDLAKIATTQKKLNTLILPMIEFADTPLRDALEFIQHRTEALDSDGEPKGFNLVLSFENQKLLDTRITLRLSNVPIIEALRYTTALAQIDYQIQPDAVLVSDSIPPEANGTALPQTASDAEQIAATANKLKAIVFPNIEFHETPLLDALDFLQARSSDLDKSPNPGINLVVRGNRSRKEMQSVRISLKLKDIPLGEALKFTTSLAGYEYSIEPTAVVVAPVEGD